MAAMTSALRMPGFFYNDMASIIAALAPLRKCHYIIAGYTPFSSEDVDNVAKIRVWPLFILITTCRQS